jgi:4-alpha-glucanotransferase
MIEDPQTPGMATDRERLVRQALRELGVRRLLFAIHDASFPSDPDEDVGRGCPGTGASARLLVLLRSLGFTGIQLGPQGLTSRGNPSPYDGTAFSRNVDSLPLASFAAGDLAGTIRPATLRDVVGASGERVEHARARDASERLLDEAFAALEASPRPALTKELASFRAEHANWLERDALYAALSAQNGGRGFRDWKCDRDLFAPPSGRERAAIARQEELAALHHRAIARYAFGQLLAHRAHRAFRGLAASQGIDLYGDLQVGLSDTDTWVYRGLLLRDYVMGAPPSRTTPAGQPWNYPVLDPALYRAARGADIASLPPGPALLLLQTRFDKAFAEYDGLRVDHPHGLVCPWVYRAGTADPLLAVQSGARLFESPDLPDHPALAAYAIARAEQLDRTLPRYADGWVSRLLPEQVERYATIFDRLAATARRHGREARDIACEVLSTIPTPLARVLERERLGRFRVTQKAKLNDATDGYRAEHATLHDWVMVGNHDTPSIWSIVRSLAPSAREQWAQHLAGRLGMTARADLVRHPGLLAHAMVAELFACPAENVMIFFADVFGFEERYNEPGTVSDRNWSLRLPASFERDYASRCATRNALDLPLVLAMALGAAPGRDEHRASLSRALVALSASPSSA